MTALVGYSQPAEQTDNSGLSLVSVGEPNSRPTFMDQHFSKLSISSRTSVCLSAYLLNLLQTLPSFSTQTTNRRRYNLVKTTLPPQRQNKYFDQSLKIFPQETFRDFSQGFSSKRGTIKIMKSIYGKSSDCDDKTYGYHVIIYDYITIASRK